MTTSVVEILAAEGLITKDQVAAATVTAESVGEPVAIWSCRASA